MPEGVIFDRKKLGRDIEQVKKLDAITEAAQDVLFQTKTMFPFDFFPDTLVIDRNKVKMVRRTFWATEEIFTMPIKSITGAVANSTFIFGSLHIDVTGYSTNPPPIVNLKNSHARRAARLINALVLCYKENINLANIPKEVVLQRLEEIGQVPEGR